jgi:DNA-binding beta-propeller fold protein YncE
MKLLYLNVALFFTACNSNGQKVEAGMQDSLTNAQVAATAENKRVLPDYNNLTFIDKETVNSDAGTKSVIFNFDKSKLFAMNLEGCSVMEFNQKDRKLSRVFQFEKTKGTGWDYTKNKPIPSFQEKPVEAFFTHKNKILWVSLHNADGIVPFNFDKLNYIDNNDKTKKKVFVKNASGSITETIYVPLIKTGRTPKVIAATSNSKSLLVSNWHSNNTSFLSLNDSVYPYGKVEANIPSSAIPRGIAIDAENKLSYIAIMGGSTIQVVDNSSMQQVKEINVGSTPRHVLIDNKGRLIVSFNSQGKIAAVDANTGKTLFSVGTHAQPRTIALSQNNKFVIVTCYTGDYVDVFKINENSFTKVASLPCSGHPVGVDIYEDEQKLEAWVCSYNTGKITIFNFKKN